MQNDPVLKFTFLYMEFGVLYSQLIWKVLYPCSPLHGEGKGQMNRSTSRKIPHCHQNSWFPIRLYEVPFHLWNQGTGKGLFVLHSSRAVISLDNHIEWLFLCCVTCILKYIVCLPPSFTSSSFLPPKYINRTVQRSHEIILW